MNLSLTWLNLVKKVDFLSPVHFVLVMYLIRRGAFFVLLIMGILTCVGWLYIILSVIEKIVIFQKIE